MKKSLLVLTRLFLGFVLFFFILLIERAGIPYQASEDNSLIVDASRVTHFKECSDEVTCLLITDSGDANAVKAFPQFDQILTDMRVPYEVADLADMTSPDELPGLDGYRTVCLGISNISFFGEKIFQYTDYVKNGGKILFWLPLEKEPTLQIIMSKIGITDIGYGYSMVDSFRPAEGFMLGGQGDSYVIDDGYESAMTVSVTDSSRVYASCGRIPLVWKTPYGTGDFVVCNFGYTDKAYRGIYAAAYSLLEDVCIYPVINGSTFYLDDWPSPVPAGDGTYIKRDYGMDIAEFYTNVWWPDILKMGSRHNIEYTGLIIETYEDITSGKLPTNTDVADYYYYGNMLLNAGGEVGYHGYNHQPLCTDDFVYTTDLGYSLWSDREEMVDAMDELTEFSEGLFPASTLQVYVPPSNVLSDTGRQVLVDYCPKITTIASTYLTGDNVYVQEFEVDPDYGIIETPRIVSGGIKDNYLRMAAFSELNLHYVCSHFMHPDDLLDVDRGADLGWKSISSTLDEYMTWIDTSAPGIRHLTGSGIAGAVQRYSNVVLDTRYEGNSIVVDTDGRIDTVYCMMRANDRTPGNVTGGSIQHLTGDLYLLEITEDTVRIDFN